MKALVVVDYQNDLVDGSLGYPSAPQIMNKIIESIPKYDKVVYVFTKNSSNYLDTFNGKMIPVLNCIEGTDGIKPYKELNNYINSESTIIYKDTYGSIELGEYFKEHKEYDIIDICGSVSHRNVFINALIIKTYCPEVLVTLVKDLSSTFDKTLEARSFNILNALGVEII